MKRIILFFAVCLGLSVFQTTFADDVETARAASKRPPVTTNASGGSVTQNTNRSVASNSRKSENKENKNSRTAAKTNPQRVVNRPAAVKTDTKTDKTVKQRSVVVPTVPVKQKNTEKRVSTTSRVASNRIVEPRKNESYKKNRSAATTKNIKRSTPTVELNTDKIADIKSKDYSRCKTVYVDCMDEFCANKDTNLRRCACSSRIHEFDNIKKQLSAAEDKMLDFNQSLLTVSLDKEDAAAINIASEGETAYDKKDKSESEKLLQKITKTLNNSGDSKLNNELSSISLSLDMDTAWDTVDSMAGVSTTAKSGLGLYNAARPVCVEMAKEICSDEELNIVESSYKLTIQQDCETVAKSYSTRYNQAQEKIHESGALLDMSRLSVHQQRNSDDILTCKKKMLTQLSDESVCGEKLYKCLDTTGQYINPSTGQAFLSTNLYNLTTLLQEPVGEETWSKLGQNKNFVNFLNSKKPFLEPATEQCQNMADTIWKEFLNDALAQIKLAQNAKLEEIRQSCTTLVAECKSDAKTTLSEFDARALSTFSVAADRTINVMCSDVETSCSELMNNIDPEEKYWETGMAGISRDTSYDNLIETCTQVGRDCIVQQCNGTSGNFALCMNATDDKRIAILTRQACWNEVLNCVASADNLDKMTNLPIASNRLDYYKNTYQVYSSPDHTDGYNIITTATVDNESQERLIIPEPCSNDDIACLTTEQIWGNCEHAPDQYDIITITNSVLRLLNGAPHNKILEPKTGSTLLSWFATNTSTTNAADSCAATGCALNYYRDTNNRCVQVASSCLGYRHDYLVNETSDNGSCIAHSNNIINVPGGRNYCAGGVLDVYGNCCSSGSSGYVSNGICVPDNNKIVSLLQTITCDGSAPSHFCPTDSNNISTRSFGVYCVNTSGYITYDESDTMNYYCDDGFWLLVDEYGNYFNMENDTPTNGTVSMSYYYSNSNTQKQCIYMNVCTVTNDERTCSYEQTVTGSSGCENINTVPTTPEFIITYQSPQNQGG